MFGLPIFRLPEISYLLVIAGNAVGLPGILGLPIKTRYQAGDDIVVGLPEIICSPVKYSNFPRDVIAIPVIFCPQVAVSLVLRVSLNSIPGYGLGFARKTSG